MDFEAVALGVIKFAAVYVLRPISNAHPVLFGLAILALIALVLLGAAVWEKIKRRDNTAKR